MDTHAKPLREAAAIKFMEEERTDYVDFFQEVMDNE